MVLFSLVCVCIVVYKMQRLIQSSLMQDVHSPMSECTWRVLSFFFQHEKRDICGFMFPLQEQEPVWFSTRSFSSVLKVLSSKKLHFKQQQKKKKTAEKCPTDCAICAVPRWRRRRPCELLRRSCRTSARPSAGTRRNCLPVLRPRCDLPRRMEKKESVKV